MRKTILTITAVVAMALLLSACTGDSEGDTTSASATESDQTTTSATELDQTTTSATEPDQTTTSAADDTTTGEESGEASITIENFAFSGASSVSVGTTVTVTNRDGVTHTWTSVDDVWNSGGISSGESFEFTFEEPGQYAYFCSIHPTMEGTVTVEG